MVESIGNIVTQGAYKLLRFRVGKDKLADYFNYLRQELFAYTGYRKDSYNFARASKEFSDYFVSPHVKILLSPAIKKQATAMGIDVDTIEFFHTLRAHVLFLLQKKGKGVIQDLEGRVASADDGLNGDLAQRHARLNELYGFIAQHYVEPGELRSAHTGSTQ